jgi:hypothetical protein
MCRTVALVATLAVGCTGRISDPGGASSGNGSGGSGAATGTGNSGISATQGSSGGSSGATEVIIGAPGTPVTFCSTSGVAITSQVPRLTNAQYDRTIADLLGVQTLTASGGVQPSTILATDQSGGLTSLAWSSYQTVADQISQQVMADPTLMKNFMSCTPSATCLQNTIVSFGRKAFRRPLSTDEITRFNAIVTNGASMSASSSMQDIATTVLYMFLISPSFLTRAETNTTADPSGNIQLSSWEVAQRLSYMLWGSIPDDTLNTAADNGALTTPAQILSQAQRMLTDDKARLKMADFHRYYILMAPNTRWDNINKDTTLFPDFDPSMVPTLEAEEEKFFDGVSMVHKGTFQDLILSPLAYVNQATAPMYGLDPSGFTGDFQETKLDISQRPGFMTRVGFLNAYAFYNRSSPIHRGAFIMKQVLGMPIGSPPPGAAQTALPDATADLDTNRKQVDAQTSGDACVGCHHSYINPAGFAMESFNAVGTWQTTEQSTGAPIDSTSDVVIDNQTVHVTGPADLMNKLAASTMAQHRYAEFLTSYLYEREDDPSDCGTVNALAAKIGPGGYTIQNLVTDLTQTIQFRTRAVGAAQ